jgi:hypothetical protein
MNVEDLVKAFRLGIIMAQTVHKVEKVGTHEVLWACLHELKGVADGEWSTYGSWEEIIPHESPVVRDEVMAKVERENREAERRIATAILSKFSRPDDEEESDAGTEA